MSWIRTAANLTRIRTVADTVVQGAGTVVHHAGFVVQHAGSVVQQAGSAVQYAGLAVAGGGARLFYSRIGSRGIQSFEKNVKRLEDLSLSTRGKERVVLLRRWLDAIKEVERAKMVLTENEEGNKELDPSSLPTLVLYQDADQGDEPLTFLDVFLYSEALEGIGLSMILDEPNDEEVALLLEIFGYCLMGGKEVHNAIVCSIKDLAKVFSRYHDEVLMKRDELLQFAKSSISGLKINADRARIEMELARLKTKLLKEIKIPSDEDHDKSSEELHVLRTQALKEALSQVRLYSKVKSLLLQKKDVHHGDSSEAHLQKVDKLKVLSDSLANSLSQAQKRIEDHRHKREETLNVRMAEANEVSQVEKDLQAEIERLQQRKEKLEAELKEVESSLSAAFACMQAAKEERQHFDKESIDALQRFQSKEQELIRSANLCKIEKDVASFWINFVESTWCLQCNFSQQNEDLIEAELEKYARRFVNLSMQLLPAYKKELSVSINNLKGIVQKLDDTLYNSRSLGDEALTSANRKKLEEEYIDLEAKLLSSFSVVESIKELLAQTEELYRKEGLDFEELFSDLKKAKEEFDSTERPDLGVETPTTSRWKKITKKLTIRETQAKHELSKLTPLQEQVDSNEQDKQLSKYDQVLVIDGQELLDSSDDDLTALESEFVSAIRSYAAHPQDLNDWEL